MTRSKINLSQPIRSSCSNYDEKVRVVAVAHAETPVNPRLKQSAYIDLHSKGKGSKSAQLQSPYGFKRFTQSMAAMHGLAGGAGGVAK